MCIENYTVYIHTAFLGTMIFHHFCVHSLASVCFKGIPFQGVYMSAGAPPCVILKVSSVCCQDPTPNSTLQPDKTTSMMMNPA